MWRLRSMLLRFGATVLDFKDNCLRMFLKAPTWTSDCVIYGQKLNCAIDSFISDHELLIEVDEGNMEPKNLKVTLNANMFSDTNSVLVLLLL